MLTRRSFTPRKDVVAHGLGIEEIRLHALHIMGHIWSQNHLWGDTHSTEMNKNSEDSGLNYICKKINDPKSVGRIGAYQTLCVVSKSGSLIPEFCAKDILISVLASLHSADSHLRLYSAEIIKNFTVFPKVTEYIDTLDLLRNLIDAFYSSDDGKMINLLLETFLNLAEFPLIRVASHLQKNALLSTELTDKVCWLLSNKLTSFLEIRSNCLKLLFALISPDTIDRIVMNMKGRIKNLVIDRDGNLVYSSLKLLHKILDLDRTKRILDFELVQNLVMNLDHVNPKIFSETVDLLSHNSVLEDSSMLKVMFTMDSMTRLMDSFPKITEPTKINFCLTVLFEFTHDSKTAGNLLSKANKTFYSALYFNLMNGDKKAKLMVMKILYQLLKFSSKTGPLDLFPDWNIFSKFVNLSFGEVKDKDYEIFSQAVVTLLYISSKVEFIEKVDVIELFKHFYTGISYKHYGSRTLEMKNIILDVL